MKDDHKIFDKWSGINIKRKSIYFFYTFEGKTTISFYSLRAKKEVNLNKEWIWIRKCKIFWIFSNDKNYKLLVCNRSFPNHLVFFQFEQHQDYAIDLQAIWDNLTLGATLPLVCGVDDDQDEVEEGRQACFGRSHYWVTSKKSLFGLKDAFGDNSKGLEETISMASLAGGNLEEKKKSSKLMLPVFVMFFDPLILTPKKMENETFNSSKST